MNKELLTILIPIIVGAVSSITTLIIARNSNKKDLTVNDRQLLSEDEKAFRTELREAIVMYRDEIADLKEEVRQLRETNNHLEIENKILIIKVEDLTQQVIKLGGLREKKGEDGSGEN